MTEPAESGMPSTAAGRALLVLTQDVENGLQEPIEDFTPAILAIEEQARLAVAPDERLREALEQALDRMESAFNRLSPEMTADDRESIAQDLWFGQEDIRRLLSEPKPASPAVEGEE